MSVALEFINLIIPIERIRAVYPGGWGRFIREHETVIGGRVWFDDHLFRDGAMQPSDIGAHIEYWSEQGLEPLGERAGNKFWLDCCVVTSPLGTPTLPCNWINIADDGQSAYLKDTEPGEVVGRANLSAS